MTVNYQAAAYTVNEGGSVNVTVTLSPAADRAVPVPIKITLGTAEAGDYRVSGLSGEGVLSFSTGASSGSFTVEALQDRDTGSETLTLGFGRLPGKVTAGTQGTAGVTINDDDLPVVKNPPPTKGRGGHSRRRSRGGGGGSIGLPVIVNSPPVFADGASAARVIAENTAAPTALGAPVRATDPENDRINYSLWGDDRDSFKLDSASGQLTAKSAFDFEIKSGYSVTLVAADTHGARDIIAVVISVTDVAEVLITNPATQAVAVAYPGAGTIITTPDGAGSVTIPAGSRTLPYHVRVDSDPANCGDGAAGEELQVCLTVEAFDSHGSPEPDAVLDRPAIVQMTLDPGQLGGADVVLKAHEMGGIRFYSRHDSDDEWAEVSFTVQADAERAAAAARSFGNFAVATDTEVFALAAQAVAPQPKPTPTPAPTPTPTPTPAPTIIPAAPAAVSGPPPSTASEPGVGPVVPPVVSAGPVAPIEETGGFPWWLLLLAAAAVFIAATGIYVAMRRRKAAAVPVPDPAEEDPSEIAPFKATPLKVTPPVAVPVAVTTPARTAPAVAGPARAGLTLPAPSREVSGVELGRDRMIPARGARGSKVSIFRRRKPASPAEIEPAEAAPAEAAPTGVAPTGVVPAVASPARAVPELPAPPQAAPGDAIPESTVPPVWGPAEDVFKVELGKDIMIPTRGMYTAKLHPQDDEDFFEVEPAEMEPAEESPLEATPPQADPPRSASPEVDQAMVLPAIFYGVEIGRDIMVSTRKRRWPFGWLGRGPRRN